MDPITITAVLASKAAMGAIGAATTALGFSSIVNFITAKKNRSHQQDLQFANQDFQSKILEKQQAFAKARDEQQFNKANCCTGIVRINL